MKKPPKLLGLAASLRNLCWGIENQEFKNSLQSIFQNQLFEVITDQQKLSLKNFLKSDRTENKPFLEVTVISNTIRTIND